MDEILLEKYGALMDLSDIAELLHITRQSMYQQIYNGRMDIPHIKVGKKYLFPTQQVAEYLENRMSRST